MPKLRRLSGDEVISILERFGFRIVAQRGSHVKLLRLGALEQREILTIPRHRELDRGTLRAILRQASRFILSDQLHEYFYTD